MKLDDPIPTIFLGQPADTEDLLKEESEDFYQDETKRAAYIEIAKAFALPPKGCTAERYIKARQHAPKILGGWLALDRSLPRHNPLFDAGVIFEIANYLISTNGEHATYLSGEDVLLKVPDKGDRMRNKTQKLLEAVTTLFHLDDQMPLEVASPLNEYRKDLERRHELSAQRMALIFKNGEFVTERVSGLVENHLINALLSNLSDILETILGYSQENARKRVLPFLEGFIVVKDNGDRITLNEVSAKERCKVFRRTFGKSKPFEDACRVAEKLGIPSNAPTGAG